MTVYKHTQPGTLVLWSVGIAVLLLIVIMLKVGLHPITLAVLVVLNLCLLLFHSLTVEVTETHLTLRFGPGLIRKSFPVAEIRDARAVRNRWYYGWGIRWTPHGWLFNVSGLRAVEIKMSNERGYRIGTDKPGELLAAIQQVCGLARG